MFSLWFIAGVRSQGYSILHAEGAYRIHCWPYPAKSDASQVGHTDLLTSEKRYL